jgi:hypothetical protein
VPAPPASDVSEPSLADDSDSDASSDFRDWGPSLESSSADWSDAESEPATVPKPSAAPPSASAGSRIFQARARAVRDEPSDSTSDSMSSSEDTASTDASDDTDATEATEDTDATDATDSASDSDGDALFEDTDSDSSSSAPPRRKAAKKAPKKAAKKASCGSHRGKKGKKRSR